MIIQLCGLSGAGKSTISYNAKKILEKEGIETEIIDGDEYRQALCKDLGFSKADRIENIRRLGFVANKLSSHNIVAIICAINPYESARNELKELYRFVKTVYVECPVTTLVQRDTKGLYKRAQLPASHPQKIHNLTGINDPFEIPVNADLLINTHLNTIETSTLALTGFIQEHVRSFITANTFIHTIPSKIAI